MAGFTPGVFQIEPCRTQAKANVWISCPSSGASTHYDLGYNIVLQLHLANGTALDGPEVWQQDLRFVGTCEPFMRLLSAKVASFILSTASDSTNWPSLRPVQL